MRYRPVEHPFVPPPALREGEARKSVIIVGAGPVGLAAALELANHKVECVVLDDNNTVSAGSRAICWSKRSLEIFDRIGIGGRAVEKGVVWKVGRTFHRDVEMFNFDLLPEKGHKRPAFINLQQYYVEEYLIDAALASPRVDLRFLNRLTGAVNHDDCVEVTIDTPAGAYRLECEYLIACDGARSSLRTLLGLDLVGEHFEERFLIADIEMKANFPSERRFWFEPEFHNGQSALLHKQPDNIYRIDLQLGWDADPEVERQEENVAPRIRRVVGTRDFRIDWVSVYTFQCRRLNSFLHGRIVFAGDAAHVVSPFGARGGNSGLQDVDSLCWRLAAVLDRKAPAELLRAYDRERTFAADENICHSSRTTKFMTPADGMERVFRDQLFKLARKAPFARAWINSGRLSSPCVYPDMPDDAPMLPGRARPGSVAPDAPQETRWLLDSLGKDIAMVGFNVPPPRIPEVRSFRAETNECVRQRYLGDERQAVYLVRPDQVIAGRWLQPSECQLRRALNSILGLN